MKQGWGKPHVKTVPDRIYEKEIPVTLLYKIVDRHILFTSTVAYSSLPDR